MANNLLNRYWISTERYKNQSVIVKEDQKRLVEPETIPTSAEEAPAHLTFRRLAVTDFSTESETESLRFYYRGHGKHLAARTAA